MAYVDPEGVVDCGEHTVVAAYTAIDAENPHGYRMLTVRHQTSGTAGRFGVKDIHGAIKPGPHLKADESWTWGPNVGTIYPSKIYFKGTAGEKLGWTGVAV